MAKKHMKKCSPSLAIKDMQIKTTLRFHFTTVRIAIIKNTSNNRCWWGCGEKGTLVHCWWECKLVLPFWKNIWRLKNLNIDLNIWFRNPTLGDILKGMWHRLLQKHLYTHVYCNAIHNSQVMETTKMPHYWWMDQENMVFIHNGIYSAMKNEILSFASKWMELENSILSEVSQAQKTKSRMFSLIWRL
jgi:hypothetical protein